jgi:hypothetical protein
MSSWFNFKLVRNLVGTNDAPNTDNQSPAASSVNASPRKTMYVATRIHAPVIPSHNTRTHTHDQHEYYYCRRWFDYSFYTTQSFMCDGSFYTLHPCVTMVIVALCTRCCCCCSGWVHALCRLSGAAQIQVEKLRDMWAVYTNMRTEQVCVTPM